jgi:hypothetical protein
MNSAEFEAHNPRKFLIHLGACKCPSRGLTNVRELVLPEMERHGPIEA